MQTERSFIEDLKYQYNHGGITIRLIFINVAVFLGIRIIDVFFNLAGATDGYFIHHIANPIFGLHTRLEGFLLHPWTLFTSIFTHYDFFHLAFNMLFLYFSGKLFEQLFSHRRLLFTYILGGLFGGILEVLAHALFPKLEMFSNIVVGASGAIMAIFIAIAMYRPQMKVHLFGTFSVRIIVLAVLFLLKDLLSLGNADGVAHFAHLGGALLGLLSIQNLNRPENIIARSERIWEKIRSLFKRSSTPKMKVKKGGSRQRFKTDEEYNREAKERQEQIDRILDKISKSGYESLTKKEKEFLFNQSKNK